MKQIYVKLECKKCGCCFYTYADVIRDCPTCGRSGDKNFFVLEKMERIL